MDIAAFIQRRTVYLVGTLLVVSLLIFALTQILPGDDGCWREWSGIGSPKSQSARPRRSDRGLESDFLFEICEADKGPRALRGTFSLPTSVFRQIMSA